VGNKLDRHRISIVAFDELCAGAVTPDTVALLEKSQYSQRKLALRALIEQLDANPSAVGPRIEPAEAWRLLAAAERRDPEIAADILLYPTVGVWLTRALHFTRAELTNGLAWPELGYLHLMAAAAAVRCGIPCAVEVPVWHGVVTLPTVGQLRLPTGFPIGTAEVRCSAAGTQLRAHDGRISLDFTPDVASAVFTPAKWHATASRGLTLSTAIDDLDPYRRFADPLPPSELDPIGLAEWRKLLDEAWDVLTRWQPGHARELAAGMRMLVPIARGLGIAGSSSPSAFGGLALAANDSATELAETMIHEFQHSKLNALLGLIELVNDADGPRLYAPWRDDPRPVTGLVHGVYAFVCASEFWLAHRDQLPEHAARRAEFAFVYRRHQVRRAVDLLLAGDRLTELGRRLVKAVSRRLAVCERAPAVAELADIAETMATDHYALWRLWFVRPDSRAVEWLASAWLADAPVVTRPPQADVVLADHGRPLPAHRRNLLHTKAIEPELFTRLAERPALLPGATALADAALCTADIDAAATGYRNRIRNDPDDQQAWVGFGIACRAQGRGAAAKALLVAPEVTVAAHRRVRTLGGGSPEAAVFADWVGAAL
jgi:HEXXH motif-containing protein